jgi:hypothetical protein
VPAGLRNRAVIRLLLEPAIHRIRLLALVIAAFGAPAGIRIAHFFPAEAVSEALCRRILDRASGP